MPVQDVSSSEFKALIAGKLPVLVDFWAPWCGPCRAVSPVIEELASERDDIVVVKINIDDDQALAGSLNVMAIPTIVLFIAGVEAARVIGAGPKARYAKAVDTALAVA